VEQVVPANAVAAVVHLIRNPIHNTVARFHLERRNMVEKLPDLAARYPVNATGFQAWCRYFDQKYAQADKRVFDATTLELMAAVPCHAEFYRWTAWHNRVIEMLSFLGHRNEGIDQEEELLTIHYEDYAHQLNETADRLFDFLQQPPVNYTLRPFRELPKYEEDHFSADELKDVARLVQHVATPATWLQVRHYFGDFDDDTEQKQQ